MLNVKDFHRLTLISISLLNNWLLDKDKDRDKEIHNKLTSKISKILMWKIFKILIKDKDGYKNIILVNKVKI